MTLASIPLMDRTGRRTLHLYGLGGMFIFSIFITISFLIKASSILPAFIKLQKCLYCLTGPHIIGNIKCIYKFLIYSCGCLFHLKKFQTIQAHLYDVLPQAYGNIKIVLFLVKFSDFHKHCGHWFILSF